MKTVKFYIALFSTALFCAAVWAIQYSFPLPGIDYNSDATADYAVAKAFFRNVQGASARFSPSDTIEFVYVDGTIATFGLEKGTAGVCFPNGKCVWSSTEPFSNAGSPISVKPRNGKKTIMPVTFGDDRTNAVGAAGVINSGWLAGLTVPPPTPILVSNYPQPVGWLWGHGVVTVGPLIGVDPSATPIQIQPVTVVDPTSGMVITTTGTVDLQGGGNFNVSVSPVGGGNKETVDVQVESVTTFRDTSTTGTLAVSSSSVSISGHGGLDSLSEIITVTNAGSGTVGPLSLNYSSVSGTVGSVESASDLCSGKFLAAGSVCTFKIDFTSGCPFTSTTRWNLNITAGQSINTAVIAVNGHTTSGICR